MSHYAEGGENVVVFAKDSIDRIFGRVMQGGSDVCSSADAQAVTKKDSRFVWFGIFGDGWDLQGESLTGKNSRITRALPVVGSVPPAV